MVAGHSATEDSVGENDLVVRLLTEICDNQREEIAWRNKVIEESLRLQRTAVRWQRIGLVVAGLVVVAGVMLAIFGKRLFGA